MAKIETVPAGATLRSVLWRVARSTIYGGIGAIIPVLSQTTSNSEIVAACIVGAIGILNAIEHVIKRNIQENPYAT